MRCGNPFHTFVRGRRAATAAAPHLAPPAGSVEGVESLQGRVVQGRAPPLAVPSWPCGRRSVDVGAVLRASEAQWRLFVPG